MPEHLQEFQNRQEWINRGKSFLNRRGSHIHATCFDVLGRPVLSGQDFKRAEDEKAYPIRWLWPNQIAKLAITHDFIELIKSDQPELDQ